MSRRVPRRTGGGQGHRGAGSSGGAVSSPILRFSKGTFTRASNGYYFTDGATNAVAALTSNVLRTSDNPNGGPLGLFEKAATNLLTRSEEFSDAAWVKVNVTVTANAVAAPDGASTADQLDFGALATDQISQVYTIGDTATAGAGVWLRCASGTVAMRLVVLNKNASESSTSITVTTAWQRFRFSTGNTSSGATPPAVILRNGAGGGTATVFAWGCHIESTTSNPTFPSSYVQTVAATATRAADSLTYASPSMAAFNTRFTFRVALYSDSATPATRVILGVGNANNELLFVSSAGVKIRVFVGSVTKVESNALTMAAAHQVLTVVVDPVAGSISVTGATTGDGTVVGTPWTWTDPATLRVGGRVAAANELNGRLSEFYAA